MDPVSAFIAELGAAVLERLNEDLEDSIALIASAFTERSGIVGAAVTGIDRRGIDLLVTDVVGEHVARVGFAEEIDRPEQLWDAVQALVAAARSAKPEAPLTEGEREAAELRSVRTFLTQVESVEDVHDHLRRITFVGGDLVGFRPPAPDAFVHVLAAPAGCEQLAIDRSFTWTQLESIPEAIRPVGAYYTVRRWDPTAARLEMLVVLHGDEGDGSAWARRARPGERAALWGPRTAYRPPVGTRHLVLVADDTALPGAAAILEQAPSSTTARLIGEVAGAEERQDIPCRAGVEVQWVHRGAAPPGTGTLLLDAVEALPPFPPDTYVWGGGEARVMTALRHHLRRGRNLPREAVSLVAYWRSAAD